MIKKRMKWENAFACDLFPSFLSLPLFLPLTVPLSVSVFLFVCFFLFPSLSFSFLFSLSFFPFLCLFSPSLLPFMATMQGSSYVYLVKIALCFDLTASYPLTMAPGREIIENTFLPWLSCVLERERERERERASEKWKEREMVFPKNLDMIGFPPFSIDKSSLSLSSLLFSLIFPSVFPSLHHPCAARYGHSRAFSVVSLLIFSVLNFFKLCFSLFSILLLFLSQTHFSFPFLALSLSSSLSLSPGRFASADQTA